MEISQDIDQTLILKLKAFYSDFFDNENCLNSFVENSLSNNNTRRMINLIMRHVKILEYMSMRKPKSDVLILFNLIIAIEGVYLISDTKLNKV